MSVFSAIDIGAQGVAFNSFWVDTLAHNMANINTVKSPDEEPFRSQLIYAVERADGEFAPTGSGVRVARLLELEGEGRLVQDPDHPLANEQGYVMHPVVDVASHMTDMIIAQRSLQANAKAVMTAEEMYRSTFQIGSR